MYRIKYGRKTKWLGDNIFYREALFWKFDIKAETSKRNHLAHSRQTEKVRYRLLMYFI